MRFGISGCFLPENMKDLTPEMCHQVRSLGFTGIFTRFRHNNPQTTTEAEARQVRDMLAGEGVRLFQTTGYWQNLVTSDESEREDSVKTLQAALRLAGGARRGYRPRLHVSRRPLVSASRQLEAGGQTAVD